MVNEQYKYSELTGKIIGCALTVYKTLGTGFQEVIYQRALAIEMQLMGINFSREFEMPIYYRDHKIGTRRVDFFGGRCDFRRIKGNNQIGRFTFCPSYKLLGSL